MANHWSKIPGWFDFQSLYKEMAMEAEDGDKYVELGSWLGKSAMFLGKSLKLTGKDVTLYCVDLWTGGPAHYQHVKDNYHGTMAGHFAKNVVDCGLGDIIVQIATSTLKAAHLFPDKSLKFVFVDADHSLEAVTADLEAWTPKVKPGGVIAGHDYTREGVYKAVHKHFGVTDARWKNEVRSWGIRLPR